MSNLVYTNAAPTGFIRGGGREVGNFAIERTMDLIASRLEMDPVVLRRRNVIPAGEMPTKPDCPASSTTAAITRR